MGYFSSKNDTNIDNEFDKKKSFNFHFDKKKLMIIMIALILIIGIIIGIASFTNRGSYSITLDGDQNIKIYLDSEYVEPGYYGYDKKGNDVTEQVEVINNVNTKELGDYTVTYSLKNEKVIRYVSVVDKGIGTTYLYLNGDKTMYLKPGESYTEPGYVVVDTIDTNLKDKVVIDGNVDTSKPGSYRLVYSVVNSTGVTTSASRTVIVLGSEISLSLSTKSSTAGPIYINVSVKDNYFDYMVLPDGSKVKNSEYNYKVTKNNTYKFIVYDTFGNKTEESIEVSNIKVSTGSSSSGSSGTSTGSSGNTSSSGSSSAGSSSSSSSSGSSSSTQKPTVTIATPKVYTSDNIESGNTHPVRFMIKLVSSGNTIYYCEDENNKCDPTTKYSSSIVISKSVKKYIRYKACDSNGNCSNVGSYYVICSQNLVSKGADPIANANGAKFYYQCDSSWSSKLLPGSKYNFCSGGCGYTSLAMVMTGLTKNYNITPVTILNDLKNTSGYYYTDSYSKGMMFHSAMWKDYLVEKYDYGVDRLFFNYSSIPSENASSSEVKKRFEESLKMGHMIVTLVPNHYIALVGYSSDNYVIVFDPANGSEYRSISNLYNYYYNYKGRCDSGVGCGFGLAYEFYPSSGMSYDEWTSIK